MLFAINHLFVNQNLQGSFHSVNIKRIKDEFFENKKVIFVL